MSRLKEVFLKTSLSRNSLHLFCDCLFHTVSLHLQNVSEGYYIMSFKLNIVLAFTYSIIKNIVVILAVRGTAQMAGRGVQVVPTTAASPSGSSVMVKTTVVTTVMSCPSTAPSATLPPNFSARTTAASPSE